MTKNEKLKPMVPVLEERNGTIIETIMPYFLLLCLVSVVILALVEIS